MEVVSCELEPIRNQIIFEFTQDARKGHFQEKSGTGVIIVETADKQVDYCRWGRVLAVGPDVDEFEADQIVLIEHLQWTTMFKVTKKQYWITTDTEIIALWDDPDSLPA